MKVYVSEKEEDYSALGKEVDGYSILEICNDLPIELVSLEQHEEEIRKPLEEKIASLERFISQLEYWKGYWYNSYDKIRNKYNKLKQKLQELKELEGEK